MPSSSFQTTNPTDYPTETHPAALSLDSFLNNSISHCLCSPTPDRCPICLDTYSRSDREVQICDINGCTHHFGLTCLKIWLEEKTTCPMCRAELYQASPQTIQLREIQARFGLRFRSFEEFGRALRIADERTRVEIRERAATAVRLARAAREAEAARNLAANPGLVDPRNRDTRELFAGLYMYRNGHPLSSHGTTSNTSPMHPNNRRNWHHAAMMAEQARLSNGSPSRNPSSFVENPFIQPLRNTERRETAPSPDNIPMHLHERPDFPSLLLLQQQEAQRRRNEITQHQSQREARNRQSILERERRQSTPAPISNNTRVPHLHERPDWPALLQMQHQEAQRRRNEIAQHWERVRQREARERQSVLERERLE